MQKETDVTKVNTKILNPLFEGVLLMITDKFSEYEIVSGKDSIDISFFYVPDDRNVVITFGFDEIIVEVDYPDGNIGEFEWDWSSEEMEDSSQRNIQAVFELIAEDWQNEE